MQLLFTLKEERDVFTNEITYIDFFAPKPVNKGFV